MESKKVLIYIPSATAKHDSKAVEGLYYLLSDCWSRKVDGYEFFLKIGMQMILIDARNEACNWALEKGMDYILWLDDDMIIPPDVWLFTQLIEHDKDIIAPLFFTRKGIHLPLIFKERKINAYCDTYDHIVNYKKKLQVVDAVGFGCILIKTEVLKKMQKPYFEYGESIGEDIYFCIKAKKAGYKIWCDTNIVLGHLALPEPRGEVEYQSKKQDTIKHIADKRKKDRKKAKEIATSHGDFAKIDIIMPCYKNFKITKAAIESIYKNTDNRRFKFTAINDGNDKDLAEYFKKLAKQYKNFDFITNEIALGCVKGVNSALKVTKNEYILICDNDIILNDLDWLTTMLRAFDDKTGMLVPTSNFAFGVQSVAFNTLFMRRRLIHHYSKVGSGFFELIKREVFDKIGFLDEQFGLGYNVDLDLSIRIRKAGYNIRIARDVFVYHYGSASLKQIADLTELEKKTRKILIDKWGKKEVNNLITIDEKYFEEGEPLWTGKK